MDSPAGKRLRGLLCALMAAMVASPATPVQKIREMQFCPTALSGAAPVIIGHRGAPGHVPENTLAGYLQAIEHGADFIETDMVSTRDGVLIARHEPNLMRTTDVAWHPEFASRRRVMEIDGVPEEGFFASDFTLQEIRTLRATQGSAAPGRASSQQYSVPTLEEILQLLHTQSERTGRRIGLYVETKHASWHQALGLPLEDKLLGALQRAGYDQAGAPVFVESFEPSSLKYLHAHSPLAMIQLIDGGELDAAGIPQPLAHSDKPYDYADMLTPHGLHEVAIYAAGIGVRKTLLLPTRCPYLNGSCDDTQRTLRPATRVVNDAHAAGLLVHPYTFRDDPYHLAQDFHGDPVLEYQAFYALGVDGVITDDAESAAMARMSCMLAKH